MNSREIVLKELLKFEKNDQYSNLTLKFDEDESKKKLSVADKNFVTRMFYGVLERKITLDYILNKYIKNGLSKFPKDIKRILRMGTYQIVFMDKVPSHAAVFETVELTKINRQNKRYTNFVNGVLRNVLKADTEKLYPDKKNKSKYISAKYSIGEPLAKYFIKNFGFDFTKDLCNSFLGEKKNYARLNYLKKSKEEILNDFKNENIEFELDEDIDECVELKNISNIEKLDAFKNGLIYFQGKSSMLVSKIVNPSKNDLILDCCSAPGGKTANLAMLMENHGKITAMDLHESRVNLINENCTRLGLKNVETKIQDATVFVPEYLGKFDKVLVDAPCSNTGIISKRPDVKRKLNPKDIYNLSKLQYNILCNNAKYVKKGGTLIYSTCSIDKEENLDVVEKFLNKNNEFEIEKINLDILSENLRKNQIEDYIQFYPNVHNIDGFFIIKLKRR